MSFHIKKGTSSKNATIIRRWTGSTRRQEFTHSVVRNDTYNYSWAFQKLAWDSSSSTDGLIRDDNTDTWSRGSLDSENIVRIFNINVTNSIDGGAKSCIPEIKVCIPEEYWSF